MQSLVTGMEKYRYFSVNNALWLIAWLRFIILKLSPMSNNRPAFPEGSQITLFNGFSLAGVGFLRALRKLIRNIVIQKYIAILYIYIYISKDKDLWKIIDKDQQSAKICKNRKIFISYLTSNVTLTNFARINFQNADIRIEYRCVDEGYFGRFWSLPKIKMDVKLMYRKAD